MQRAAGEDVAVGGAVDQFDALAQRGELHDVLADDVAGTQDWRIAGRAPPCSALAPSASAVPDGASFLCTWCDSTMSQSQPGNARAARSTSSFSTATPRLKFDAHSTGMRAAAAVSASRCAASRPVVPDTSAAPRSTHSARIAVEAFRQAEVDRDVECGHAAQLVCGEMRTPSTTRCAGCVRDTAADHDASRRARRAQPQQGLAHAAGGAVDQHADGRANRESFIGAG